MKIGMVQGNSAVMDATAEDVGVRGCLNVDAVGKINVIIYLLLFIVDK